MPGINDDEYQKTDPAILRAVAEEHYKSFVKFLEELGVKIY